MAMRSIARGSANRPLFYVVFWMLLDLVTSTPTCTTTLLIPRMEDNFNLPPSLCDLIKDPSNITAQHQLWRRLHNLNCSLASSPTLPDHFLEASALQGNVQLFIELYERGEIDDHQADHLFGLLAYAEKRTRTSADALLAFLERQQPPLLQLPRGLIIGGTAFLPKYTDWQFTFRILSQTSNFIATIEQLCLSPVYIDDTYTLPESILLNLLNGLKNLLAIAQPLHIQAKLVQLDKLIDKYYPSQHLSLAVLQAMITVGVDDVTLDYILEMYRDSVNWGAIHLEPATYRAVFESSPDPNQAALLYFAKGWSNNNRADHLASYMRSYEASRCLVNLTDIYKAFGYTWPAAHFKRPPTECLVSSQINDTICKTILRDVCHFSQHYRVVQFVDEQKTHFNVEVDIIYGAPQDEPQLPMSIHLRISHPVVLEMRLTPGSLDDFIRQHIRTVEESASNLENLLWKLPNYLIGSHSWLSCQQTHWFCLPSVLLEIFLEGKTVLLADGQDLLSGEAWSSLLQLLQSLPRLSRSSDHHFNGQWKVSIPPYLVVIDVTIDDSFPSNNTKLMAHIEMFNFETKRKVLIGEAILKSTTETTQTLAITGEYLPSRMPFQFTTNYTTKRKRKFERWSQKPSLFEQQTLQFLNYTKDSKETALEMNLTVATRCLFSVAHSQMTYSNGTASFAEYWSNLTFSNSQRFNMQNAAFLRYSNSSFMIKSTGQMLPSRTGFTFSMNGTALVSPNLTAHFNLFNVSQQPLASSNLSISLGASKKWLIFPPPLVELTFRQFPDEPIYRYRLEHDHCEWPQTKESLFEPEILQHVECKLPQSYCTQLTFSEGNVSLIRGQLVRRQQQFWGPETSGSEFFLNFGEGDPSEMVQTQNAFVKFNSTFHFKQTMQIGLNTSDNYTTAMNGSYRALNISSLGSLTKQHPPVALLWLELTRQGIEKANRSLPSRWRDAWRPVSRKLRFWRRQLHCNSVREWLLGEPKWCPVVDGKIFYWPLQMWFY